MDPSDIPPKDLIVTAQLPLTNLSQNYALYFYLCFEISMHELCSSLKPWQNHNWAILNSRVHNPTSSSEGDQTVKCIFVI